MRRNSTEKEFTITKSNFTNLEPSINRSKKMDEFRSDFKKMKDTVRHELAANEEDLPNIGNFTVSPKLAELKEKTTKELKRTPRVTIENEFGKVTFLEPINLLKKNYADCIDIQQDSIEIIDSDWDGKKCELTFKNFGDFASLESD